MKYYLLGVLVLVGVVAWSCRTNREWKDWEAPRDSTLTAVQAREDSANRLLQVADSLFGYSVSQNGKATQKFRDAERMVRSALHYRDSVLASLGASPDTCLPWLLIASRTEDSLVGALRVTQSAFDSLQAAQEPLRLSNTALLHAYQLQRESVDSLTNLVGRVPHPKKWAPVVTVGYGAVLNGGVVRTGPSVSLGIKIPF